MTRNPKAPKIIPLKSDAIAATGGRQSSAEDVFVAFMSHESFQIYTSLPLLRSEQLRAIYTVADLARQRAEGHSPAPSVREIAAPRGTETYREKELRNALQSAKKRLKNLRNTLKQRNKRIAALEGRARPLTGSSAHVARTVRRPATAARIPSRPLSPKTPIVGSDPSPHGW